MTDESCLKYESARLPRAGFIGFDVNESAFTDMKLHTARFDNVALTSPTLRNVCLGNFSIVEANLDGMTINAVLVIDLFRAHNNRVNST